MSTLIVDLTSYEETYRSFIEGFAIQGREHLMDDYFIGQDRGDLSSAAFLAHIGKSSAPITSNILQLNSLHVTTNDDRCSTIRALGIMDLQAAVTEETPLRLFLSDRGIRIDVAEAKLIAGGASFQLNRKASGSSATNNDAILEYVSWKLYRDFPVCGFVCSPDALAYRGNVNQRPEFLNNISTFLDQPDLVTEWEESTQTYVIKFGLPIGKYETPNVRERVGDLILQVAYDYIFNGKPASDVYSFLPPHVRVEPHEILDIYTADEYKSMISS